MVIHDLTKSTYTTEFKGYTFYFSSMVYKKKFDNKLYDYISEEISKLFSKYKLIMKVENLEIYFSFALYQNTEKRGVRVFTPKGEELRVLDNNI